MKWSQQADQDVVQVVVMAFRNDVEDLRDALMHISTKKWERSFYWLDASGMALYLLRRLEELGVADLLPPRVRARLVQNLADNAERSVSMLHEFKLLNRAFQDAGVEYCNLKGFTLSPNSCPHPSLRTQLDFDFLLNGADLKRCCEVLSTFGYALHASTDTVFEFKTYSDQLADISNLYKPREQRSVELHFPCADGSDHQPRRDPRLQNLHSMNFEGFEIPTLSSADQLIGQATHILSHLCGPSTRLAWLLEFRNHLTFHSSDRAFLDEVLRRLDRDGRAEIAMGAVCLLTRILFDCPIPAAFECGPVQNLPPPIKLWINRYGSRSVLADFPGTKLHLLLREQLESDTRTWERERSRALLPLSRPPRIFPVKSDASLGKRIKSEFYQLRYEAFRLRFHVFQGLAYLAESRRWRRLLKEHAALPATSASLRSETVPTR
jgi:hypothetical protein